MKLKSVSGVICYVSDVGKSTSLYETVGFTFRKREPQRATAYLNWFWIDLIALDAEPRLSPKKETGKKGAGPLICISVDDVDGAYQELLSKGLKPVDKPQDSPWGGREFFLLDPDDNKLAFFQRK